MDTITRLMAQMMVDNCSACHGTGKSSWRPPSSGGSCPSCTPLRKELEFQESVTLIPATYAETDAIKID